MLNNLVIVDKHLDRIGSTRSKTLNNSTKSLCISFTFLYISADCAVSFFTPNPSSRHLPRINIAIAIPFRIYCGKQQDTRDNSSILSNAATLNI